MAPRKDNRAIHIRCEPAFYDEAQAEAERAFEGNVALFTRDALRTVIRLRRVLGPRYELIISGLLSEDERVAA